MNTLVPLWILGAPFVGLVLLSFSTKGSSAMGGTVARLAPRDVDAYDRSAPLFDPMVASNPRRIV